MIKLPARPDGQWTVRQNSDKLPDLIATRNLTFDKEGYLRLSKPVISYYSDGDDADFGLPIYMVPVVAGTFAVCTNEAIFNLDMVNSSKGGYLEVAENTSTGIPKTSTSYPEIPGAVVFNKLLHYTTEADVYSRDSNSLTSDWTDRNVSAQLATNRHPLANFTSNDALAVGDGNEVEQFTTAYATETKLTISANVSVTGMAYNNGYLGITTTDFSGNGQGMFIVWDGKTTAANYSNAIGCNTCTSPIPYRGSFAFLTGNGELLYWTPNQLQVLGQFPSYYNGSSWYTKNADCNRHESAYSEGEVIYFNVDSTFSGDSVDGENFTPEQPGGIWCYDPAVGLYHRHAPTATKAVVDVVATGDVDTSDDEITVTASYPSGTPVRYSSGGGTALAGLVDGVVYYTIYVDATTIQLASSYTNALAGTEIDLTGTGNNDQTLQFYPKPDFGQSYLTGQQGYVQVMEETTRTGGGIYYQGLFYGSNCSQKTTTPVKAGGFVLKDTENRGYFVTAKFMSQGLQDTWQKLYIKHNPLVSDLNKIAVKYRTSGNDTHIVKSTRTSGTITWTYDDTFTTTDTQWANVEVGDEVEIIEGAGSGYLLHVSSITEDGGTYTVVLDESVKNIVATDTGRAVVSRWTLAKTLDSSTPQNEDGYSEISIGKNSKSIQFKIELRGEDVEIEELLVAHEPFKKVV